MRHSSPLVSSNPAVCVYYLSYLLYLKSFPSFDIMMIYSTNSLLRKPTVVLMVLGIHDKIKSAHRHVFCGSFLRLTHSAI